MNSNKPCHLLQAIHSLAFDTIQNENEMWLAHVPYFRKEERNFGLHHRLIDLGKNAPPLPCRGIQHFWCSCNARQPQTWVLHPKRYWKGFGWFQAPEDCNFPPNPPPEKYGGHPVGTLQKVQRRGRFEGWKGLLPKSGGFILKGVLY